MFEDLPDFIFFYFINVKLPNFEPQPKGISNGGGGGEREKDILKIANK
jgi:hypothetical protein